MADENTVLARVRIRDCVLESIGMKRDLESARRWYRTVAKCGESQPFLPFDMSVVTECLKINFLLLITWDRR